MKKKYWLPALLCSGIGLLIYIFIFSYSFTGIVLFCTGALIAAFGLANRLKSRFPKAARIMRLLLWLGTVLVLLAAVVTGSLIVRAGMGAEEPEADYVIVLGAGVNGTHPSRSLYERLVAAEAYLNRYPDSIAVLSGGQGDRENITEALCMFNWLTEKGIPAERLRVEDKASSTEENIRFSLDLMEAETGKRPTQCAVVSNTYHLLRASLLAGKENLQMLGVPAKARPMYFCNMLLREIVGVWYTVLFR